MVEHVHSYGCKFHINSFFPRTGEIWNKLCIFQQHIIFNSSSPKPTIFHYYVDSWIPSHPSINSYSHLTYPTLSNHTPNSFTTCNLHIIEILGHHYHQRMLIAWILLSLAHPPSLPPLLLVGPLNGLQCSHKTDECKFLLDGQHQIGKYNLYLFLLLQQRPEFLACFS